MSEQRYRVLERLDAGGMAEVFKGEAESLRGFKKQVAIKRILPSLTKNKKFVSMFLDEARLTLQLNHANIVHVFDIGVADGTYFIVMEYVDGANLKTIIEYLKKKGQRLPVAQAVLLMIEICKGLSYAHELQDGISGQPLNIVHRDISPPNILISKVGEVKLVDFGLAKAASQLELTDPGVVKGKFSYLSPEAASGLPVDHRSDVFSAGIVLYEMLTGKRLFVGETDYQTVELVRKAYVPPVARDNSDVPRALEEVVRKALARDVNQRYQSSRAFGDALAQVLFSHGLKVTQYDIENLVKSVIRDKQREARRVTASVIDSLLEQETLKFHSLDEDEMASLKDDDIGAKPLVGDLFADSSLDAYQASISASSEREGRASWGADDSIEAAVARRQAAGAADAPAIAASTSAAVGRAFPPSPSGGPAVALAAEDLPAAARAAEAAPVIAADGKPAAKSRSLIIALLIFFMLGAGAALLVFKGGLAGNPGIRSVPAKTE